MRGRSDHAISIKSYLQSQSICIYNDSTCTATEHVDFSLCISLLLRLCYYSWIHDFVVFYAAFIGMLLAELGVEGVLLLQG